ncbi:MAG: hypothetical protein EBV27_00495, partial [Actinobacteria bacterium]|nr:hypothetical protein [Actinomycetota bacterium]
RVQELESQNKLLEAQRIKMRTAFDLEMIRELGFCSGIENYSRYFDDRPAGSAPNCLLDYFPEDFLLVIDESHVTVPQIGGMYEGDASRKRTLVEYGFRLPSALDNRPLKFNEFQERIGQTVYLSATPGPYELGKVESVVEQVIRPTGLVDPEIRVKPTKGQIDDLLHEVKIRAEKNERVMKKAIEETNRRREKQIAYNKENGIDPKPLRKKISDINDSIIKEDSDTEEILEEALNIKRLRKEKGSSKAPAQDLAELITELTAQMKLAASELNFELAARYRDEIHELKKELRQMVAAGHA